MALLIEPSLPQTAMLSGHVDVSPMLVHPQYTNNRGNTLEASLNGFLSPFSYPLWACLIALVFVAGLVDCMLEWEYGGTITLSVYEYYAGVLWGGFMEPKTKLSAVYQVCAHALVPAP